MQYSDYQSLASSEKITLAILSASKRLMGWALHSGSIYKITGFTYAVISAIEDSGTAYTAVTSVGAVTAGKYYLDRSAQTLYVRTTGSDNPNGRFIVATVNLYFANVPVTLPNDLAAGFDVYWEPLVKSTSQFGVSIDTIAQTSEAIEGSGTLTLVNDFDFWPTNFDKLSFENQQCSLYSYHRDLTASAAALIFKGRVDTQGYTKDTVVFQLKDQFAALRSPLPLPTIGALGARTGSDLELAFQRSIFGRVYGNVPTNIDQVLTGYPLTGTVSVALNGTTVTGSGTAFLTQLSPDDTLSLGGTDYTIASVTSDTSLELTTPYTSDQSLVGATTTINPSEPKRYMNRVFKIAGHALREASTTVTVGSSIDTIKVASTRDIYAGDVLYVGTLGSGEQVRVQAAIGDHYLSLATSLATIPVPGTTVLRPAVQNVRIDDVGLTYYTDYTLDASTATLTLRTTAESNASPIYQLPHPVTITNGSHTVSGTGFQAVIKPGYMLGVLGNVTLFEVLSVDSDTQVSLRTPATFSAVATGRYQDMIYNPSSSVLTVDVLGRTDDGTTSGVLLKTAPSITKALLTDAGLASEINTQSFTDAEGLAYQELGFVVPEFFDGTAAPSYRDVMNMVNKSVFGALVQNANFQFGYHVLRPRKTITATRFSELDILSFSLTATAQYVVKTCIVEYGKKEHDYTTKQPSVSTQQSTSDTAHYLVGTDLSKTISTVLVNTTDANTMASRWSFILQNTAGRVSFTTKLQGFALKVGDVIEIEHRKFYERYGSTSKRKLLMIESIMKNGTDVSIDATDLSNTFNRVAAINGYTPNWTLASAEQKLYGGFITDQYGLISNDSTSFATNLIW